jgi:RNA polymerase sigma factor (sigma-70 family)
VAADDPFAALIRRVRAGDAAAAAELVAQCEPEIRRAVRIRLTDPGLRRVLDSMDVCQSVLANFFVRAAGGQFELGRPEDLIRLLVTMARNKLRDHARRQHAERRDQRRTDPAGVERLAMVPAAGDTPSQIVAGRELLEAMRARLSEEERLLAHHRAQGRGWEYIATQVGGSPEALRKKLARAIDRVAHELGLDEVDHA